MLLAATALAATFEDARRATMQVVFESIHELLVVDTSQGGLADPANEARILTALRELDDQSAILAAHGFPEDYDGTFLAGALDRYAYAMLRSYEHGSPQRLRSLLYHITDVCIACHTRLPSPVDTPLAREFVDSDALASLDPAQRAKLEVATRRFDTALRTLEQIIASPDVDPNELEEALTTYLVVNIRVKEDFARPIGTLERVRERPDVPADLRRDTKVWIEMLKDLRARPPSGRPVDAARRLVREAESVSKPGARSALVHYVTVSALLRRYLENDPPPSSETAEAHFLLGLAEYRMSRGDWLPQAELHLETAIHEDPGAPWAPQAYALLEERVLRAYEMAPRGEPPPEVRSHLERLRQMIE